MRKGPPADTDRFPGYDVLNKRETPSWDAVTRRVIERRLATPREPSFLSAEQYAVAEALCRRILPQPASRPEVPLAALLDAKLKADHGDGFRDDDLPYMPEAWKKGLDALDAEARTRQGGRGFVELRAAEQDDLLEAMQKGEVEGERWRGINAHKFFTRRILVDVPGLYYGHPTAWSEIGFGGPASPRGYVRLDGDRHDPWEATEAKPGEEASAYRKNRRVV